MRTFNREIAYKMLEGLEKELEEEDRVSQRLTNKRN